MYCDARAESSIPGCIYLANGIAIESLMILTNGNVEELLRSEVSKALFEPPYGT